MATSNTGLHRFYIVDVLAALFGIASWVAINGVYVEFPLLVEKLPEQWDLPSYLTVTIQAANIGPILFGVLHRFSPQYFHETSATILMMIVGTSACILLVLIWDVTAVIGGKNHSVALIVLVFFVSLVDCTSSVVFAPFMGYFKKKYIISLFVGEGLSGLLPGLVSLGQEIGRTSQCENVTIGNGSSYMTVMVNSPPFFGVEAFFGFLCVMMGISFVAFVLLRFLPSIESERPYISCNKDGKNTDRIKECDGFTENWKNSTVNYGSSSSSNNLVEDEMVGSTKPLTTWTYLYLLGVQVWMTFFANGVLPSISSYYCLPYGDVAYHLATSLSSVANPLICLATFYLATRTTWILTTTAGIGTILAAYLIVLAALSPNPLFVGTSLGQVLVVVCSIGFTATISYTKTSIAKLLRTKGVRALFWYGVATQVGSTLGAISMFVAVNFYHAFKSYNPCI